MTGAVLWGERLRRRSGRFPLRPRLQERAELGEGELGEGDGHAAAGDGGAAVVERDRFGGRCEREQAGRWKAAGGEGFAELGGEALFGSARLAG